MKLFNEFGIDIGYVVLGMAGVILLMFIMLIVTMAKNSSTRKIVTRYKGSYINAWYGTFQLKGKRKYLDFLYQTGVGSKNSQGFGMFEII